MNAEAKCASLDRISNLPSSIIENILCLVSIRDAVRTSILSKNWRYNWVKIPKLEFYDGKMFDRKTDENQPSILERSFISGPRDRKRKRLTRKFKVFYAIHQVLSLHQGPIVEFSLDMQASDITCVEIDQLIIHLARNNNTLKKFTLQLPYCTCILPRSIFSLHQLTDLYISFERSFNVDFGPVSNGFGSLTSLTLIDIVISGKALLCLLSNCQLLKRLEMGHENGLPDENVTTIELLNSLPMIEHFNFYRWVSECLTVNSDPRELPTALVHLKYFCLYDMILHDDHGLDFLCLVMRSSPNLKKFELHVEVQHYENWEIHKDSRIESASLKKCSDIWLEHLEELEIEEFSNIACEMEFVKLILAKSPVLKKVSLRLEYSVTQDKELEISRILTRCPRASPLAEIIVKGRFRLKTQNGLQIYTNEVFM